MGGVGWRVRGVGRGERRRNIRERSRHECHHLPPIDRHGPTLVPTHLLSFYLEEFMLYIARFYKLRYDCANTSKSAAHRRSNAPGLLAE